MPKHVALKRLGMIAVLATALAALGGFTVPAGCDGDGRVAVNELIVAVDSRLGNSRWKAVGRSRHGRTLHGHGRGYQRDAAMPSEFVEPGAGA